MRLLIQRVKEASVTVDGQRVSAIGAGLLVFIGVFKNDGREQAAALAKKTGAKWMNDFILAICLIGAMCMSVVYTNLIG